VRDVTHVEGPQKLAQRSGKVLRVGRALRHVQRQATRDELAERGQLRDALLDRRHGLG
jgi:hypothetical protein